MRALAATAFDNCDDLFWRVDSEYAPITMMVSCSDVFAWGCADCETITDENIDDLEKAYIDDPDNGAALFCARLRGMRPQGFYYQYIDKDKCRFSIHAGLREKQGSGIQKANTNSHN